MLLILLFTQRQIANGVVDAFDAMTVPPAEGSAGVAAAVEEEPPEATTVRGVGVQFYEPQPLSVEVARTQVSVAAHQAMNHARDHVADSQAP